MNEYDILHYKDGVRSWEKAPFADEQRIDIVINGVRRASVMATPSQLEHLALGFLFNEGFISSQADIEGLLIEGTTVSAKLKNNTERFASFSELEPEMLKIIEHPQVSAREILALMDEFNEHSYIFRHTGAVHSCCLVDGERRYFADDVGRHNALDKVIGFYLGAGASCRSGLVLTTGRISTEILLKSAKAGLGMVISRSAATDRAVELARKLDMIMVGFCRGDRFNVYHGGDRIDIG